MIGYDIVNVGCSLSCMFNLSFSYILSLNGSVNVPIDKDFTVNCHIICFGTLQTLNFPESTFKKPPTSDTRSRYLTVYVKFMTNVKSINNLPRFIAMAPL
jgi:hypothetical protein